MQKVNEGLMTKARERGNIPPKKQEKPKEISRDFLIFAAISERRIDEATKRLRTERQVT